MRRTIISGAAAFLLLATACNNQELTSGSGNATPQRKRANADRSTTREESSERVSEGNPADNEINVPVLVPNSPAAKNPEALDQTDPDDIQGLPSSKPRPASSDNVVRGWDESGNNQNQAGRTSPAISSGPGGNRTSGTTSGTQGNPQGGSLDQNTSKETVKNPQSMHKDTIFGPSNPRP